MTIKHECLHEKDFGILFTKIDLMTETMKAQTITNTAILKYITSMQAINGEREKEQSEKITKSGMSLQKAIFYSSIILSIGAIVTAFIIG